MRRGGALASIEGMLDPDEIVDADDELSEVEREDELDDFDPIDLVEAHLAGVPFN